MLTRLKSKSISELLSGVPNTETVMRLPPRPPQEPVAKLPSLDVIDKAIEAAQINLQSYEHARSDVLLRFHEAKRQFQGELDDVNRADEETQQRLLDLQYELRRRLELRGYVMSLNEEGDLVASIPQPMRAVHRVTTLEDLDDIEPRKIAP